MQQNNGLAGVARLAAVGMDKDGEGRLGVSRGLLLEGSAGSGKTRQNCWFCRVCCTPLPLQ